MTNRAFIGLGSNLGDRRENLDAAVSRLRGHPAIDVLAVSTFIETAAEPAGSGPDFLNGVLAARTTLTPEVLLAVLLDTEAALGRVRGEKDGPRVIDLDLLTHGRQARRSPALTLPHPRMAGRAFVMGPLREVEEMLRPQ